MTPPVDALPVRPAAPQTSIAPAAPPVQTTAISQGDAPQQLVDASQGNMTMLVFAPQPVDQTSKADAIDRRRLAVAGPPAGGAGLGRSPSSVDMGGMNLSGGGGKIGGVGGAPLDIG